MIDSEDTDTLISIPPDYFSIKSDSDADSIATYRAKRVHSRFPPEKPTLNDAFVNKLITHIDTSINERLSTIAPTQKGQKVINRKYHTFTHRRARKRCLGRCGKPMYPANPKSKVSSDTELKNDERRIMAFDIPFGSYQSSSYSTSTPLNARSQSFESPLSPIVPSRRSAQRKLFDNDANFTDDCFRTKKSVMKPSSATDATTTSDERGHLLTPKKYNLSKFTTKSPNSRKISSNAARNKHTDSEESKSSDIKPKTTFYTQKTTEKSPKNDKKIGDVHGDHLSQGNDTDPVTTRYQATYNSHVGDVAGDFHSHNDEKANASSFNDIDAQFQALTIVQSDKDIKDKQVHFGAMTYRPHSVGYEPKPSLSHDTRPKTSRGYLKMYEDNKRVASIAETDQLADEMLLEDCQIKLKEEEFRREYCEKKIEKLQAELLVVEEKLAVVTRTNTEYENDLKILSHDRASIAKKHQQFVLDHKDLLTEVHQLKESISQEKEQSKKKIEAYKDELDQSLEALRQSQEHTYDLRKQVLKLKDELHDVCTRNQTLSSKITSVEDELEKRNLHLAQTRSMVESEERKVKELKQQIAYFEEEKRFLRDEYNEQRQTRQRVEEERDELIKQVVELKDKEEKLTQEITVFKIDSEKASVELRNFYQNKLQRIVEEKMKEFQQTMDQAMETLVSHHKDELDKRDNEKYSILRDMERLEDEIKIVERKNGKLTRENIELCSKLNAESIKSKRLIENLRNFIELQQDELV